MMRNRITPSINYKGFAKPIKDLLKVPRVFKPTNENRVYKTLDTSVIYNPLTPPFPPLT